MRLLLSLLTNNLNNPTKDWPKLERQELVYDMRYKSINNVRLSSRLEDARVFGRCGAAKRIGKEYLDLYYKDSGLILEYESGQLFNVRIIVGPKSYDAMKNKMKPANPAIINLSGRMYKLNEKSAIEEVKQCFGEPTDIEELSGETILMFEGKSVCVESYHEKNTNLLLHLEFCETEG